MIARQVIALSLVVALVAGLVYWLSQSTQPPAPTSAENTPVVPDVRPTPAPPIPARTPVVQTPTPEPAPEPLLALPVHKEARFNGRAVRFLERRYVPIYPLPHVADKACDARSPEELVAAYTTAMVEGDFYGWLACWDRPGQSRNLRNIQRQGVAKDTVKARWRQMYTGRKQVLTRRIDIPGYVIIYHRGEQMADDHILARAPVAIKKTRDGQWRLTHDLWDHPVYMYDSIYSEKVAVTTVGS